MQALGAEEPGRSVLWLLFFGWSLAALLWLLFFGPLSNSSRWAGLQALELGPWQSCLTGPQAALRVGRRVHIPEPACWAQPADSRASPALAYCGRAEDMGGEEGEKNHLSPGSLECWRTGVVTSNPSAQNLPEYRLFSIVQGAATGTGVPSSHPDALAFNSSLRKETSKG